MESSPALPVRTDPEPAEEFADNSNKPKSPKLFCREPAGSAAAVAPPATWEPLPCDASRHPSAPATDGGKPFLLGSFGEAISPTAYCR